jgi:hypothetical protein
MPNGRSGGFIEKANLKGLHGSSLPTRWRQLDLSTNARMIGYESKNKTASLTSFISGMNRNPSGLWLIRRVRCFQNSGNGTLGG